jgi:hypothetical protein
MPCAAGNRHDARRPRRCIQPPDAADEIPRIREVDIVHAAGDAGFHDLIAASLKRPGRIDQKEWSVLFKHGPQIAIAIRREREGIGQLPGKPRRSRAIPAGDQHRPAIRRQPPREPGAETTVAAKNDDALHSTRSASSGEGTQQASRRPKIR